MFDLGVQELIVILLIALFFFGGEKIPEIARGLGKGIREFKRTMKEIDEDERERRMKDVSKSSTNAYGSPIFKVVRRKRCQALYTALRRSPKSPECAAGAGSGRPNGDTSVAPPQ